MHATLPSGAGVSFKPQHFAAIAGMRPAVSFFEVHAENYLGAGGPPHARLGRLRADHALSLHGVGLSIGSEARPDRAHLARLRALIARYEPESFSEHLAWSSHGGEYLSDLLPLPYTQETLARVCAHVDETQDALGRAILLENPSTYVRFAESELTETDFLGAAAARTGCGLLLDVNNAFVCAVNHGFEAAEYLRAFPLRHVGELHLAGHATARDRRGEFLIDTHGSAVADPVWALYESVIARTGPLPTLIEWDNEVPEWPVLAAEAARAVAVMAAHRVKAA